MKLEINIKKRQVYFLSTLIVLAFGILFVQGQGISNYGHDSDQVEMDFNGVTKTLQEAYNDGTLKQVDCVNLRSTVFDADAVAWCNTDHPKVIHCSIADDQAPTAGPTVISTAGSSSGTCQSNGACHASNRGDLGGDVSYLEIVVKDDGITEGCWQYDYGHSRKDYHLDLICCK